MTVLSIDFETRATVDLRETGVYPYAQHPDTDIWCMAWAFDDEEPEIWTPSLFDPDNKDRLMVAGLPDRIIQHIGMFREIRAWNAAFERIIWNEIMARRYGAPKVKLEQWVCSAAEAAAMALPRSLDQCAQVTGVQQQKDQEGNQLMMRMTRPRSVKDGVITWWDVEERKQRLYEYCKQDVRTERALVKVLRRLTAREREHYLETERANDRGIPLDRELVLAAKEVATEGIERANAALCQITGGAVTEVTKVGQIKGWLHGQGVDTESISKAAVRELLESDVLSPEVRQVLELRAEAGRSSIAKLDSLLACCCNDGRIRGMLLYHGASTGRWTGRLAQVHNFPRGEVDAPDWPKDKPPYIETFIPDVLERAYDRIGLRANPISVISSLLRSCLTATPETHDLIAADYSAIEARVVCWLAGQDDVIANWAAYDAGDKSRHQYRINASRLYKTPVELLTKDQYQGGKFQELGCGFGMGWKKAISAGKAMYDLDLSDAEAKEVIDNYRNTHSEVVQFWNDADAAAMEAVGVPGKVVEFGALRNLKFVKAGAYLYLILPSRRPLCYAAPRIVDRQTPWGEMRPAVEISAVDTFTKQWGRMALYGGLLVENIVQAVSRDIMAEGILRVRDAGYSHLFSVHDECVCEVPKDFGSLAEFERLLATPPDWAQGCPIATEGWRGFRFRK